MPSFNNENNRWSKANDFLGWLCLPKNTSKKVLEISKHTVGGRNPTPVDRLFISLFTRDYTCLYPRWCRISSINSIMASPCHVKRKDEAPTFPGGLGTSSSSSMAIDLQRLLSKGPEPWTWSQGSLLTPWRKANTYDAITLINHTKTLKSDNL